MIHDRRTLHRIHANDLSGRSVELPSGVILRDFGAANERGQQPAGRPGCASRVRLRGQNYCAPFAAGLLKATAPVDPDQVTAEAGRGHERSQHTLRPKRYTSTVSRDRPRLSRAEVTVGRARKRPATAGSRLDPDHVDDSPDFRRHASADDLELYSLKRLVERDLGRVERHLLVCEGCRRQLTETDATVNLIRAACRDYEGFSKG